MKRGTYGTFGTPFRVCLKMRGSVDGTGSRRIPSPDCVEKKKDNFTVTVYFSSIYGSNGMEGGVSSLLPFWLRTLDNEARKSLQLRALENWSG